MIHIRRKHTEIRKKVAEGLKNNGSFIDNFLRNIGLARIHEYEADLRWVFEEMNRHKINPYGQIMLMEKLKAWEENRGYHAKDVAHGDIGDRALTTESVFFFLPLDSLSITLRQYQKLVVSTPGRCRNLKKAGFGAQIWPLEEQIEA